jgi:hypothetical protein
MSLLYDVYARESARKHAQEPKSEFSGHGYAETVKKEAGHAHHVAESEDYVALAAVLSAPGTAEAKELFLEGALEEAQQVPDSFLVKLHPDMPRHWRDEYVTGIELWLGGSKSSSQADVNRGCGLVLGFRQWCKAVLPSAELAKLEAAQQRQKAQK